MARANTYRVRGTAVGHGHRRAKGVIKVVFNKSVAMYDDTTHKMTSSSRQIAGLNEDAMGECLSEWQWMDDDAVTLGT